MEDKRTKAEKDEGIARSCPICGHYNAMLLEKWKPDYSLYRCRDCKHEEKLDRKDYQPTTEEDL